MKAISWHELGEKAARKPGRLILADGHDPRVVEAACLAERQGIARPTLIGPRRVIETVSKKSGSVPPPSIDPSTLPPEELAAYRDEFLSIPRFKKLSKSEAEQRIRDPLVLGCLHVRRGFSDGFVGGATRTTAETLRAVFTVVGLAPTTSTLFGFFLIEPRSAEPTPPVLLADCAVVPDPSAKQLAQIGAAAASAYEFLFESQPKVAFLSFSTEGSAQHPMVDKIKRAAAMARTASPDRAIAGEWQADTALDLFSAQMKGAAHSAIAGQANVLIVPDLNCGNVAYKLLQRVGGCRVAGPVLWGTAKPANDLSRGCSVQEILDMLVLTTLQTQRQPFDGETSHA